jgi:hypothetical protein
LRASRKMAASPRVASILRDACGVYHRAALRADPVASSSGSGWERARDPLVDPPTGLRKYRFNYQTARGCAPAFSRRDASELCVDGHPSNSKRAQGKPDARCTRGLVCKTAQKNAHEHTGPAEAIRPSLRNGFNGCFVLSPVSRALLPPSPARLGANLTPASGCQDHTTSPSASAPFVFRRIRVHRNPPRVRDDRESPLLVGRDANHIARFIFRKNRNVFAEGAGQGVFKIRK